MNKEGDIASICTRLVELDAERDALKDQLERLQSPRAPEMVRGHRRLVNNGGIDGCG
jgi:hypothetical protein